MKDDNLYNEHAIIEQCQNGDKHAYGILVDRYMKRAYFTALGLVGVHEAALDLSQEAFVRAYRSIKKLDANKKFYTWFYRILRNLCLNNIRDNARHASSFSEIGEDRVKNFIDSTPDASSKLESAEIKDEVWKAINSLTDHEREIIIMKDFQEMPYKEIAHVLDIPIGTVMSRLYNARKALKNKLERYFHE